VPCNVEAVFLLPGMCMMAASEHDMLVEAVGGLRTMSMHLLA
jgi:hypothetical protein